MKDRPCTVVIAIEGREGHPRVIVLPVTHSPPQPPDEGIELPQQTKTRLGLDDERSWVIASEGNDFVWPGPDLRFLPGRGPESAAYGFLPPLVYSVSSEIGFSRATSAARLVWSPAQSEATARHCALGVTAAGGHRTLAFDEAAGAFGGAPVQCDN